MINYFYDCYSILLKVYRDKTFIKQAINSTPVEEKNRSLTVKTCYGVLDKDIELSYYISKTCRKSPKLAVRTVMKIAMYAVKYLGKKPYAVTENAVELLKKLGKGGTAGFANAFLRKFVSSAIPLPSDEYERLSVTYSYPLFAVKTLTEKYGKARAEKIMAAENGKNCVVFYETDGEEYLKRTGAEYEKTPYENVFLTKGFVRNADYDGGVYTFQALGSVAVCDAVSPCKNLLDCCAAPGGKTVRLSYIAETVTAWDIHPHRVNLITEYKTRMRRENISESVFDATVLREELKENFDAVLCDAPCSGTGVFNDNPDMKLNKTEESVNELTAMQNKILDTVCRYVKEGGYLYYSTCSIMPKENGERVKEFLKNHAEFELEEIKPLIPAEKEEYGVQFLPDISGGLGFFVAKMKRINRL